MRAIFLFSVGITEFSCKLESKLLKSRVLAGGFVIRCAKSLGFKHIKKVVEKSAV